MPYSAYGNTLLTSSKLRYKGHLILDMNLTVPATYILFFVILLVAGLLGYFIKSCCFWLEKDEKDKATQSKCSECSSNVIIVINSSKPDHGHQPLHSSGRPAHAGRSLPGLATVHTSDSRIRKCTSI